APVGAATRPNGVARRSRERPGHSTTFAQEAGRLRAMLRLPDGARLDAGAGGLERLSLATPAGEARLFLQGAHLAHFQPAGEQPILWLGSRSRFEAGKGNSGGGAPSLPWVGAQAGAPPRPAPPPGRGRAPAAP